MDREQALLIEKIRAGDESAFALLASSYKPLIDSMAKKYFRKSVNAGIAEEDFVQEATMAFYSAVCSYADDKGVTFGLYAKICLRNRLVSMLRSLSKKQRRTPDEAEASSDPAYRLLEKEAVMRAEKKIRSALSELEWSVLCLYLDKKSYDEISEELGIAKKSVDNALYRIKKKLKKPD